jgi:ppGpp synthetase/RelA/SpoT-type nucleotidyltranferase
MSRPIQGLNPGPAHRLECAALHTHQMQWNRHKLDTVIGQYGAQFSKKNDYRIRFEKMSSSEFFEKHVFAGARLTLEATGNFEASVAFLFHHMRKPIDIVNYMLAHSLSVKQNGITHGEMDTVKDILMNYRHIRNIVKEHGPNEIPEVITSVMGSRDQLILSAVDDLSLLRLSAARDDSNLDRAALARRLMEVYSPILHIWGYNRLDRMMCNEAFMVLEPEIQHAILATVYDIRVAFRMEAPDIGSAAQQKEIQHGVNTFETLAQRMDGALNYYIQKLGIDAYVQHRLKGVYSIYEKLNRLGEDIGKTLERIPFMHDILGLRIITSAEGEAKQKEDMEALHRKIRTAKDLFPLIPGKLKNYAGIKLEKLRNYYLHPKENGYQSIHYILDIAAVNSLLETAKKRVFNEIELAWIKKTLYTYELQLRTMHMHIRNEYGASDHFGFKFAYRPNTMAAELGHAFRTFHERRRVDGRICVSVLNPTGDILLEQATHTKFDYQFIIPFLQAKARAAANDSNIVVLDSPGLVDAYGKALAEGNTNIHATIQLDKPGTPPKVELLSKKEYSQGHSRPRREKR